MQRLQVIRCRDCRFKEARCRCCRLQEAGSRFQVPRSMMQRKADSKKQYAKVAVKTSRIQVAGSKKYDAEVAGVKKQDPRLKICTQYLNVKNYDALMTHYLGRIMKDLPLYTGPHAGGGGRSRRRAAR